MKPNSKKKKHIFDHLFQIISANLAQPGNAVLSQIYFIQPPPPKTRLGAAGWKKVLDGRAREQGPFDFPWGKDICPLEQ